MKIAVISFLIDSRIGGGAATSVNRLADGLISRGHDVVVITSSPEWGVKKAWENGKKIWRVRPANLYWVGDKQRQPLVRRAVWQIIDIWNAHVYYTLRRLLAHEQPDVVHVNKLRGLSPAVWSAAAAAKVKGIVHTCRDYELISPQGTLDGIVGQWAMVGRWPITVYQRIRRYFSRHVHVATAPSEYTLGAHVDKGFFQHAEKKVVPNSHGKSAAWLESKREAIAERRQGEDGKNAGLRILYLGRIEAEKGVQDLLKAFSACAERYADIYMDVVGWGLLEDQLKRQYGGHPRIHFHGKLFGSETEKILDTADVVVVPSRWPEVFGNVIVEAFAMGKPVIGSTAGAIPELIEPGRTGFLFREGDVEELARTLSWCAENKFALLAMSEACIDSASRYSLDVIAQLYEEAYISALEGQHRIETSSS